MTFKEIIKDEKYLVNEKDLTIDLLDVLLKDSGLFMSHIPILLTREVVPYVVVTNFLSTHNIDKVKLAETPIRIVAGNMNIDLYINEDLYTYKVAIDS